MDLNPKLSMGVISDLMVLIPKTKTRKLFSLFFQNEGCENMMKRARSANVVVVRTKCDAKTKPLRRGPCQEPMPTMSSNPQHYLLDHRFELSHLVMLWLK